MSDEIVVQCVCAWNQRCWFTSEGVRVDLNKLVFFYPYPVFPVDQAVQRDVSNSSSEDDEDEMKNSPVMRRRRVRRSTTGSESGDPQETHRRQDEVPLQSFIHHQGLVNVFTCILIFTKKGLKHSIEMCFYWCYIVFGCKEHISLSLNVTLFYDCHFNSFFALNSASSLLNC